MVIISTCTGPLFHSDNALENTDFILQNNGCGKEFFSQGAHEIIAHSTQDCEQKSATAAFSPQLHSDMDGNCSSAEQGGFDTLHPKCSVLVPKPVQFSAQTKPVQRPNQTHL